jgi:hypothetical protein
MTEIGERSAVAKVGLSKRVTGSVVSLTFRSDLLDGGGGKLVRPAPDPVPPGDPAGEFLEWADATGTFAKPDWVPGRSDPVVQVKGTKVRVDFEVRFTVHGKGPVSVTRLEGVSTAPGGWLTFRGKGDRSVSDGQTQTFTGFASRAELPGRVDVVVGSIRWRAVANGKRVELGTTGPHRIYVVLDRPGGKMECPRDNAFVETGPDQHVTTRRLRWAVEAARGKAIEKDCVDAVFLRLMNDGVGYHLGRRWETGAVNNTGMVPKPGLHHYLWACNGADAVGECHNIAAAFALACRILGARGTFEVGVMFPWPSRAESPPDYPRSAARTASGRPILGKYNERYLRDHLDEAHGQEALVFLDHRGAGNNFEGVVCYEGKALYAIGDDVFDRFDDPHDNASCYYATREAEGGRIRREVHHVMEPDRLKGMFELVFSRTREKGEHCGRPYPWKRRKSFYWHEKVPRRRP